MENPTKKKIEYDKFGYRIDNPSDFKPKPYFTVPENEKDHENFLNTRENSLKEYKYYDELPIMSSANSQSTLGYTYLETGFFKSIGLGIFTHILIGDAYYGVLVSNYKRVKSVFGWSSFFFTFYSIYFLFSFQNQPQNWGVFEPNTFERKMQNLMDLKFDLYQNVDLIKYEDKHLSRKEIRELHRQRADYLYAERKKIWRELGL